MASHPLDDLFSLPLFSAGERSFVSQVESKLASIEFESPTTGVSGIAEVRSALQHLGRSGLLQHVAAKQSKPFLLTRFCLARELIARNSLIADLAFVMQALGSLPIQLSENAELKKLVLPGVLKGTLCAAFAISEPEAGSDVAALKTSAKQAKDGSWRVSGTKHLISNAGAADFYCVFARTGKARKEVACFFVPADSQGLEIEQTPPLSPHPLGIVRFDKVEVPSSNVIAAPGKGLTIAFQTLARARPSVGAAACGFAFRALDLTIKHVQRRKAFGGVLGDQQLVQALISQSVTELDAARLMVYRACKAFDADTKARHDRSSSEAKYYATEVAQKIIDRCVQLHGGQGVLEGSVVAELYKAIRPLRIYEGASEVQLVVIARSLFDAS